MPIVENNQKIDWQQRYHLIYSAFQHSTDAILITDVDGIIIEINQAFNRMFGWTREEAIGASTNILRSEQTADEVYDEMWRSIKAIGEWKGEIVNRCKDGRDLPVLLSITPIFENGEVIAYMGVEIDLSQRKKTENALKESEERHRSIIQTAGSVIIYLSNDQRILEFNHEAERVLGYQRQEVLGKDCFELFLPNSVKQSVRSDMDEVLRGSTTRNFENPVIAKDGSVRTLLWNVNRLVDASGQPVGIVAIGQDITERKRIEKELKNSTSRIEAIVETAVDGIITIDEHGVVDSFNQAAERIFGYESQEVIGQNVSKLMPEPYHSEHDRYVRSYLKSGTKKIIGTGREVVGLRKDKSTFPMHLSVSDVRIGKRRMFTGIVHDLTAEKTLQHQAIQAERLAAIGKMAARVAHEIRNPLSSISLNTELLEDEIHMGKEADFAEAKTLLKSIIEEVDRVANLTEEYLQFSRLPTTDPRPGDLVQTVQETLDQFEAQAHISHIQIQTDFAPDLPTLVFDSSQIRRALLNLLRNAKEAMPRGGVLRIDVDHNEGFVILKISDTGQGIADKDKDKIFEPFYTTKEIGTGLGLALTRQVVQEHGGDIRCDSQEGKGTTFAITLPKSRT